MKYSDKDLYKRAQKAIKRIALMNDVTVDEVKKDIEEAIRCGMNSDDESVRDIWKSIPCKSDMPTAEEVISWSIIKTKERTEYK